MEDNKNNNLLSLPDHWGVFTIQNLLDREYIVSHLDGNHGELYPRSQDFKDYGVPYISANDFLNGFVDFSRCKFLSETKAKLFKKGIAKDGDVLFAHNATVGPVALLKTNLEFVILSTTATYFRCNKAFLCNIFFKYTLQAPFFVKQYQAVMAQSTRFQVPITTQRKLSLVLPPLPEQQAIATAFSDTDALITSLDHLIAKKRDIKQATMQQLLTGKRRLPGFSKELKPTYKRTEIGMIPLEWDSYKFVQIATIRKKKIDPKRFAQYSFCIELEHIGQNSGQLIGYSTINEASSLKAQFNSGDVLFGRLRAYLRKYWLADRDGICSTEIWPLVPNGDLVTKQYLFQLVQTDQFIEAASIAYGTHMPRADWSVIKNYEIPLPLLDEQQAIATILSDMDAEIAALEQKREKTHMLKQGMMQELLTGKTRLI